MTQAEPPPSAIALQQGGKVALGTWALRRGIGLILETLEKLVAHTAVPSTATPLLTSGWSPPGSWIARGAGR